MDDTIRQPTAEMIAVGQTTLCRHPYDVTRVFLAMLAVSDLWSNWIGVDYVLDENANHARLRMLDEFCSVQFFQGYLRASTVIQQMPADWTKSDWLHVDGNRPMLSDTQDFKNGYNVRVQELLK
jgi:hypothetical protein